MWEPYRDSARSTPMPCKARANLANSPSTYDSYMYYVDSTDARWASSAGQAATAPVHTVSKRYTNAAGSAVVALAAASHLETTPPRAVRWILQIRQGLTSPYTSRNTAPVCPLSAAWAAASRATGTRKGEHDA